MKGSNGLNYYMPISVTLTDIVEMYKKGWHIETDEVIPAHDLIIKPLLDKCIYCYVYGIKNCDDIYSKNKDILIKENGKYKLDITKECVKGHESLWNSNGHKRGSIIIILENNINIFYDIFKYTCRPGFSETPNLGNTVSALKKCKEEMENGNIGICFSGSNGLEYMEIYIKEDSINKIKKIADENCNKEYNFY
jgi:hypothetical protein